VKPPKTRNSLVFGSNTALHPNRAPGAVPLYPAVLTAELLDKLKRARSPSTSPVAVETPPNTSTSPAPAYAACPYRLPPPFQLEAVHCSVLVSSTYKLPSLPPQGMGALMMPRSITLLYPSSHAPSSPPASRSEAFYPPPCATGAPHTPAQRDPLFVRDGERVPVPPARQRAAARKHAPLHLLDLQEVELVGAVYVARVTAAEKVQPRAQRHRRAQHLLRHLLAMLLKVANGQHQVASRLLLLTGGVVYHLFLTFYVML